MLYAVVFCTRYINVFRERYLWNLCFKVFYITSSFYIIGVMLWVYPRTREKELAWKMGAIACAGSIVLSPFAMLIFEGKIDWGFESVRRHLPACYPTFQPSFADSVPSSGFGPFPRSSSRCASCHNSSYFGKLQSPRSSTRSIYSLWVYTAYFTS